MSALEEIRTRAAIDIDQLDPVTAEKLGPFHDMTSNQALIASVVTADTDTALWEDVMSQVKQEAKGDDEAVDLALDLFVRRHP